MVGGFLKILFRWQRYLSVPTVLHGRHKGRRQRLLEMSYSGNMHHPFEIDGLSRGKEHEAMRSYQLSVHPTARVLLPQRSVPCGEESGVSSSISLFDSGSEVHVSPPEAKALAYRTARAILQ